MAYRSERFDVGELAQLGQVFAVVDNLENAGLTVVNEVMAGNRYRRQLHPDTKQAYDVDYLLQVTLDTPEAAEGMRYRAGYYIEESRRLLGALTLPGDVELDPGGLSGNLTEVAQPFGAARTEDAIIGIFPPWVKSSWSEHGRSCLFFCGILPPQSKDLLEDYHFSWNKRAMRSGRVVFKETPNEVAGNVIPRTL